MMTQEILSKIRRIQIHTKKIFKNHYAGDYKTRQRGFGLEFDQLRSYELGDDVRSIDWKSSARAHQLLVKQYFHESSKTILIALDTSASMAYGSQEQLNYEVAQEIATILAYAGFLSKSSIGFLRFSGDIEEYIPPRNGQKQLNALLNAIWRPYDQMQKTSLAHAFEGLIKHSKKDTLAFVISDFIDASSSESALKKIARLYDLVLVRCLDRLQKNFDIRTMIDCIDPEYRAQNPIMLDAATHAKFLNDRIRHQDALFTRCGASWLDIDSASRPIDRLVEFFVHRLETMR